LFLVAFSFSVALIYAWWAGRVYAGWKEYKKLKNRKTEKSLGISIVIPFRNEAKNLPELLKSIESLNYPKEYIEVLFVNDHSDDEGNEIINQWNANLSIRIEIIQAHLEGKKAAQHLGVSKAQFDLIACSDADCVLPKNWLRNIASCFDNPNIKLAFGPVGFLGKGYVLQRLEFLSLIGSTMAMLQIRWPVMGNAANMAFTKSAYFDAFPNTETGQSASGDDVFLLHEVAKEKGAIGILAGNDSVVKTKPQENLQALFSQRLRWASKASLYTNKVAIAVASLVFFVNILALFLAVASLFSDSAFYSFLMLMLVKTTTDFILIKRFASFYAEKISAVTFVFQEFFNLIYIPAVALASQFLSFTWKGRRN
jgi:cellulose synthase/poly-beta-1,6-N-acetylglucosamine synthase-like glycosyltransferase